MHNLASFVFFLKALISDTPQSSSFSFHKAGKHFFSSHVSSNTIKETTVTVGYRDKNVSLTPSISYIIAIG